MYIEPALLYMMADASKTSHYEVMELMLEFANKCKKCPCNVTHTVSFRYNVRLPIEQSVWILRGYYPNTSVFFKMTIVKSEVNEIIKVMSPKTLGLKKMVALSH